MACADICTAICAISADDVTATLGGQVTAAIASLADGLRGSSRSRAEKEALEAVARQVGVEVYCEQRLKVIACIMGPNAAAAAAATTKEKDEARRLRKNLYMKVRSDGANTSVLPTLTDPKPLTGFNADEQLLRYARPDSLRC
jgi:hypothetical protein